MLLLPSGIKHLEEIRIAGYEIPAVNQIEVCDLVISPVTLFHLLTEI